MIAKKAIGLFTAFTVFTLGASLAGTMAWFANAVTISNTKMNGSSEGTYFAYGDGTSGSPYGIRTPRQLYNLAWMQYAGNFNKNSNNVLEKQYYFEIDPTLSEPLDMSGWTLPPIGTETYPFLGNFNGNNKTISNLTVTNPDEFESKPTSIHYNDQPKIVGFFGVIGEIVLETGGTLGYEYDTAANRVVNVTLNNITISSETSNTLVGLAGGYVNGTLSGVKVGKSTISVNGCKPISTITQNLSDYSLVGYTASTSTISDFTKQISDNLSKTVQGGNIGGFGASVNFKDYLTWFYELHQNKSYGPGDSKANDVGYMSSIEFSDAYITRWNTYDSANNDFTLKYNQPLRRALSDPSAAFTVSFSNQVQSTTNYAVLSFSFYKNNDENKGYDYDGYYREYLHNGTYEQSFTATTTTVGSRWNLTFNNPISRFSNYSNFDLLLSSGTTVYVVKKDKTTSEKLINISWAYCDYHVYHLTNDNFIPLDFNENKTSTSNSNTGYIIGTGLASNTNNYGGATPRISSYGISYLNNSMSNGEISSVYTVDTAGSKQQITETKTDGVVTGSSPSYERYVSSRKVIGDTLQNADVSYGIHFDVSSSTKYANSTFYRGSIANDSSDTYVEHNMLLKSYNGTAKTTRMPKGSIDFELEDTGYINFFAGMYNSSGSVSNLNFFSLHHVIRSSPTNYTLKEIKYIYRSTTWTEDAPHYVYKYTDDSYSSGTVSGDPIFNLEASLWAPREKDNSIYYFEIPVNQGEYAIGSVDKSHTNNTAYQGAYLLYLDIGSNGRSSGNTTMNSHYIKTTSTSDSSPTGVDFNTTNLQSVGGNTICIALTCGNTALTGSIEFNPGANVLTNSKITGATCVYDKGGMLNQAGSSQGIAISTGGSGGEGDRIIRASIVTSTGDSWELEYQEILNGDGSVRSHTYTNAIRNRVDVKASVNSGSLAVPEVFTTYLGEIKDTVVAVELEYHGSNFSISNVSHSKPTVSLTIVDDLGSITLTVSYPQSGGYSELNINGSPYVSS